MARHHRDGFSAVLFLRSQRWEPETLCDPVPSRAVIAKTLDAPDQTLAALTAYHGNRYREKLYR